jgi:coenzyme F420 hydrogenase subunit beta
VSEANVVTEVVAESLCCGCGVCAGVCSQGSLQMRFNSRGELAPALTGACSECALCLRVCPALEVGELPSPEKLFGVTPGARRDPHLGQYIECLVGYSPRHRHKGASGGMATWTLEELLRQGRVDAAVCVGRSERKDRFFETVIVSSESDLLSCSSSKYYPVEFSSVLTGILSKEGRYAIVALPCAATAIRKAQRAVAALRDRIRYVFGLACGHGVSRQFTDFLLAVTGLEEASVENVDFRHADRSRDATNFAFRGQRTTGKWSRPLFFDGLYGRLWAGRFFVPRACDFCDDLFAPLTDATFMDAWLPHYAHDARGTSIVVARHPEVAELLRNASQTGACDLHPIRIEHVRQSQSAALAYKTAFLPLRVARAERDGRRIPRSFPRAPLPGGFRERLAKIKHAFRDRACRWTFDCTGRARHFWVSVLTAYLRGQWLCRTARHRARSLRNRARGAKPRQARDKR